MDDNTNIRRMNRCVRVHVDDDAGHAQVGLFPTCEGPGRLLDEDDAPFGWEEFRLLVPLENVGRLYTGSSRPSASSFFSRISDSSDPSSDPGLFLLSSSRLALESYVPRSESMRAIYLLLLGVVVVSAQRRLALPDPRSCANRVRHSSYRDGRGVAHSYFFSWEHGPTRNLEVDWLDARNICRRHCMDAVSLETPQENEFIKQRLARGNVRYIWTSGRKCNFNGCDRPDLQPQNINGWFWSGSGAKIGPTTQRNSGDWSNTGGYGQPQPDNREAAQGNDESCLSILNNFYNDGIKWHDVACHHVKPFVCEDSDELLNFVASRNPGIRL